MTASPHLLCSSSSALPPTQEQKPPASSSLTAHMGRQVSVHKAQDSGSQVSRAKEASSSSAGMADHRLIFTSVCGKPFAPADTTPMERGFFSSFSSACSSFSSLCSSVAARDGVETVPGLEEVAAQFDKRPATVTHFPASLLPPLFKSVSQKLELRAPVLGPPATGAVPKTASATSPTSVTQESSKNGICGSPTSSPQNASVPAGDSCQLYKKVVRNRDVSYRPVGATTTYATGAKETQGATTHLFAQESLTTDSDPSRVYNVLGFDWSTAFDKAVPSGRDLHDTAMIYSKSQPALTQLLGEKASPREKQGQASCSNNSSSGSVPCALAEIPAEMRKSALFQTFPVKVKKSTQFLKRSNTGGEDFSVSPQPSFSCRTFPNDPFSGGLSLSTTGVCGKAAQSLLAEKDREDFAQAACCNATAHVWCHGPRPRAKTDAPGTSAGLTLPLSPRSKLCDSNRDFQSLSQSVSPLEGYYGAGALFTGRTDQNFAPPGQQVDGSGTNATTTAQFKASLRSHTRTWNPLAFLQSSNGGGGSEDYSTTSVSGPGPMSSRSLGSSLRKLSTLQSPVSGTVYEHTTSSSVFGRHDPQERLADFLVVHSQKLAGAADAEAAFSLAAAPFIERGRSATADPTTELNRPHSHFFSAGGFSLSPARPRHASGFEIGSATFAFPDTYYTPVFLSPHSTLSSQEEDSFSPSQFGCARKQPDQGPPCGDGAATAPASTMVVSNPSLTLANFVSSMNAEIQRSHSNHSRTNVLEVRRSETSKLGLAANAVDVWDTFNQEAPRSPTRDTVRLDCYPPLARQFCSGRGGRASEKSGLHLGASYPFFSSTGNLSPTLFDEPDGPFVSEPANQTVAAAGGGFPATPGFSVAGRPTGFPSDYKEEVSWTSRMRQQSGLPAPLMLQKAGKRKQGTTSNVARGDATSSPGGVMMSVPQMIGDEDAKADADHSPYYACWSQHQVPSWASTAVATPTGPRVASITTGNGFDCSGHRPQCTHPSPHEKYKPAVTENNFFLQPGTRRKTSLPPRQRSAAPYVEARQRLPRLLNPGVPTPSPTKNHGQDDWKSSSCQQPGVFHNAKAISSLLQGKGFTNRTERTPALYDSSRSSLQPWVSTDHKTSSVKGTEHSCPASGTFSVLLTSAAPPPTTAFSPHQQSCTVLGSQAQRFSDAHSEGKPEGLEEAGIPSCCPALSGPLLSDSRCDVSGAQYRGHTENAPGQTPQHTHNVSRYEFCSPFENRAVPKRFNQTEWQTFVSSAGPSTDTHWDVLCSMDEVPAEQSSSPSVRSQKGHALATEDDRDKDASRETCALLHGMSGSDAFHRPSVDIEYEMGSGLLSPCNASPVPLNSAVHRLEGSVTGWDGNTTGAPLEPPASRFDNPFRQHLPTVPSAPRVCCGIQDLASFHTTPQSPLQCSSSQQHVTVSPDAWPKPVEPEAPLSGRPACEGIFTGFASTGAVLSAPVRGARTETDFSGAPEGFRRGERSSYARCGVDCLESSDTCFQEQTRAMGMHQLAGCCGVVAAVVSPVPYGTVNSEASVKNKDKYTASLSESLRNVPALHGRPPFYPLPPPEHQPSPLASHGCVLPKGSGISCAVLRSASGEEPREGHSTNPEGALLSSSTTFNLVLGGVGAPPAQPQKVYSDDRDRMVYVSWIPKKARAYNTLDKRRMELSLKRKLREDLCLAGLTKVLLFPPKGVHCKLIFDCRRSATSFMACYGGDNRSVETERWKTDLCRIYHIDMHDKFNNTIVKIEWSQK